MRIGGFVLVLVLTAASEGAAFQGSEAACSTWQECRDATHEMSSGFPVDVLDVAVQQLLAGPA